MMRYDFIIVGGGLVGLSLVVALRDAPYTIALVDAKLPSADDPRLYALNSASIAYLNNLNVLPKLSKQTAAIHSVHVSHKGHFGVVRLTREALNLEALGEVVPAALIESALHEAVLKPSTGALTAGSSLNNITIYRPAKVLAAAKTTEEVTLTIATETGEQHLQARFVIGADGNESTIRQLFNVPTKKLDYQQTAIVTQTVLNRSHEHRAYERFITDGAIAMLPLAPTENIAHRAATIWTTKTTQASKLLQLADEDFLHALQTHFGYRLGRLVQIGKRYSYPLKLITANHLANERVMLIGNAAHSLHPVAALSLNLGLYETATLSDYILKCVTENKDFTPKDLQHCAEHLQSDQSERMQIAMRLPKLLEGKIKRFAPALFSAGMVLFDLVPIYKKRFMQHMMGYDKQPPTLLLSARDP